MRVTGRVIRREEVKRVGHPDAERLPKDTELYQGPMEWVGPRRDWEQVAALEGTLSGSVIVTTAGDLSTATHVELDDGLYEVVSVEREGTVWQLLLRRRP